MSKSTISTFQLFALIPDEESARVYLEALLWPDGPVCPSCITSQRITARKRVGFYRCNQCKLDFTVRTATIFERSHVPLHKWVYAMYLVVTSRKGISSMQMAKEIGVTQKTAWFMLGRLREACAGKTGKDNRLGGMIEVDECFVGGKEANKHAHKKLNAGRGSVGKVAVLGLRERGGETRAMVIDATDHRTLHGAVHANVKPGSLVCTDEAKGYEGLDGLWFNHRTVNHGEGEYAKDSLIGRIHTNSIESVWAVLKRSIIGTWHQVSPKHLGRYVNEVTFRLNAGNVENHTLARLDSFIRSVDGKRLTYARLTA
jgi:transposase-like protein